MSSVILRRHLVPLGLLALYLSAVPASASATAVEAEAELPTVLTLDEAVGLLRERGIDILVAESAVASAEGDLRIAGAIPNPGLAGSIGKSYQLGGGGGVQPYGPPAFSVFLSDNNALAELITGKRGLRQDVARAALAASRGARKDVERTLVYQLRQQFLLALQAQRLLLVNRENQQGATQFLDLTDRRYRLGAISEADVARVRTAKLESDQAVDTAAQALLQAKAAVGFYLGQRGALPQFELKEGDYGHYALPSGLPDTSIETLLRRGFQNRPDLKAARAQLASVEAALTLARRQRVPDVGLTLGYSVQGFSSTAVQVTPPTFSLGLSTTVPVFYFAQGEVQKAAAAVNTQRLLTRKAEAQVTADVVSAYAGFSGSSQLVQRMETGGLLDSAKRARDLVLIQYQKGAASLLDFLTAQQTFNATRIEYQQDLTGYWNAVFQLEQAMALEIP